MCRRKGWMPPAQITQFELGANSQAALAPREIGGYRSSTGQANHTA
jgi:hypothetical protein